MIPKSIPVSLPAPISPDYWPKASKTNPHHYQSQLFYFSSCIPHIFVELFLGIFWISRLGAFVRYRLFI